MELIDKSAIVEEIKKCEKICEDYMLSHKDAASQGIANAKRAMCQHIIKIINTLEVKEVDLDRAIDKWIDDAAITHEDCSITDVISTAKHFFELGIKIKKGEISI